MPRRDYNLSRSRNLPDKNDYASILRSTTRVTRAKISDLISAGIVVQSPNSCKLIFSEKVPRLCAKITRDAWINDGTESYTSVSSWLSSNLLRYGIKITLTEDVAWTMVDFCGKNFAIICDAYWNYCAKRGRFTFTSLSVDSILHKHKPSKEVTTLIKYTSEIKQKILDIIGDGQLPKSGNVIVMDFNKSSGNENNDNGDNDIKSSDGTDDSLSSSLSSSSQLADGKGNNNQSKSKIGNSKESNNFYNIKFNDCKVPALRTDFFFLENGEGDKIDSSSNSSSDDDDSKSRKHVDYIPYDLMSSVECPLCFNVMDNPVVFPCSSTGHPACFNCVKKLIKFSVGVSAGKVESHIPVKCPVCSEVAQLPVKACDIETFFKKFEPSAKAAEFISFFMSKDRASLPAPLNCPKHNGEFVSYDVGAGIPLCKDCVAERGPGAGIVLPMKTCANIVKHTADVLCSASSEFEDRCVDYVNTLEQAAVFSGRSVRNVENAINAEADFLHSLIDKKRTSLSYNAHKIAKQRLIEIRENGFCEKESEYYKPLDKESDDVKRFFESWGHLGLEKIDLTKSDLLVEMDGPLVECGNCTFFIVVRTLRTSEGNVPSSYTFVQKAYLDLLEFSIFNGDTPVRMSLHGNWHPRDSKCVDVKTEYVCQARVDLQLSGFYTMYASISPSPGDRCSICEFFVEPSTKRRK